MADNEASNVHSDNELFRLFKFERVLYEGALLPIFLLTNEDPFSKSASVLGRINDKHAVLILEKTAFGDDLPSITKETESPILKIISGNDIYRWYHASLSEDKFSIKATIIYPATDVHIRKHERQRRRMVKETPEIFKEHIESYIQTMKGSRIQWLYNILDHKAETEKIIYEDPDPETGFLLLPDLYVSNELSLINSKWDGTTISSLYLCAIFRRYDLSSIRDLNESHIPLLQNDTEFSYSCDNFKMARSQCGPIAYVFPLYLPLNRNSNHRSPIILSSPHSYCSYRFPRRRWHGNRESMAI